MLTRRALIGRIGQAGGMGAAFAAMQALGLMSMARAQGMPALPPTLGKGNHVIVLGAGIAGLVSAYELQQAGFLVTLLEARDRVGGRAWTVRDGDKIEMEGEETQTARFSDGIYFNAGPARIPSFHTGLIGYANKFDVPLEVEVNSSRSSYIVAKDGKKMRMRTAINDFRGDITELLTKAINQGSLDQAITPDDKAKLLPFLRAYGDLDEQYAFKGTERSGFGATSPGAGLQFGSAPNPTPLGELLANEQLGATLFEDALYMQATMFQPVGGMDRIHAGFDRNLKHPAIRGAAVTRIRQNGKGVDVTYRDTATGVSNQIHGDYLICTIPFSVLSKIDTNFAAPVKSAIAAVQFDHSNKIAFEAPRFWEKEQIYGGITWVGGPTSLIWYPSAGLHSGRGMLLACYASSTRAADFQKMPIAEQIEYARTVVEKVHPGHGKDLENGLAVNWNKVPYSLGPWPNWNPGEGGRQEGHIDTPGFRLLLEPDGRTYFATAALSQTPGWQEGGIQCAHLQVMKLVKRVTAQALAEPNRPARRAA